MSKPTIGGESVTLPDFSAYKAITAMEIVGEVEQAWREVVNGAGDFEAEYMKRHAIRLTRAEARRQYRPKVVYQARHVERDDEKVEVLEEPVLGPNGQPLLGPDPLGHLTDADWQASGNELVIPERPSKEEIYAAMVPLAFRLARVQVLRLLALALATNKELEKWDEEGEATIPAKLDEKGKSLLHEASADELVKLAVAVAAKCKDQLGGPFDEAATAFRQLWPAEQETQQEAPTSEPPPPMAVETDDSGLRPESSTESQADTGGSPPSSSTASSTGG